MLVGTISSLNMSDVMSWLPVRIRPLLAPFDRGAGTVDSSSWLMYIESLLEGPIANEFEFWKVMSFTDEASFGRGLLRLV